MTRSGLALLVAVLLVATTSYTTALPSAAEVAQDIFQSCLSELSTSCVKPKSLAWLSSAVQESEIKITEDLSIVRTAEDVPAAENEQRSGAELFDQIDGFLATHSVRVNAPAILRTAEARAFGSDKLGLDTSLVVPLAEGNAVEGRGFVKKIVIPFLLGLKFKTTVLLPLAFALIALKTWKATTLGLLSMVLSAAMLIFKFAKPKVVNYEVVHYPQHHVEHHLDHHLDHHLVDHHLEHHIEPHHLEHLHVEHPHLHVEHPHPPPGWEPHGWARSMDAQKLAYSAQ